MTSQNISMSVINRLPRYYRFLNYLKLSGVTRISSRELSEKMGLTASQIRHDLNCFGGFGQQGYGYIVSELRDEIGKILGVDKQAKMILVGAGNMGQAVVTHLDFESRGFMITGIFDNSEDKIGKIINGIPVLDWQTVEEFCKEHTPEAAMICIPTSACKSVAEKLIGLGVNCFWNFSHYDIALHYPGTIVENVHLGDNLLTLSYRFRNNS